jgi:hypothetical protein
LKKHSKIILTEPNRKIRRNKDKVTKNLNQTENKRKYIPWFYEESEEVFTKYFKLTSENSKKKKNINL